MHLSTKLIWPAGNYFVVLAAWLCWPHHGANAAAPEFSFVAFGDMYDKPASAYDIEKILYQDIAVQIRTKTEIPFAIDLGDIGRPENGSSCNDAALLKRKALWWNVMVKPVFYTPGDNDWTDCDRAKTMDENGKINPVSELYRLDQVRKWLTDTPQGIDKSWGYERQENFPENAIWRYRDVVFITLHIVGTFNGRDLNPARPETLIDDKATTARLADERDQANALWLRRAFTLAAEDGGVRAVVMAIQADPFEPYTGVNPGATLLEQCVAHPLGMYKAFCSDLGQLAGKLNKPVLLIHGDTSPYCLDRPAAVAAPLLWRLNAPGDFNAFDAGAALVTVAAGDAARPFQAVGLLNGQPAPAECKFEDAK
ncbi:MAG: hypothetical protein EPN21_11085 [Methylococcaceae bacterium]|nr:MAG: hypothetical protein EPN21_11085 [Methylococcaceae bacterium]